MAGLCLNAEEQLRALKQWAEVSDHSDISATVRFPEPFDIILILSLPTWEQGKQVPNEIDYMVIGADTYATGTYTTPRRRASSWRRIASIRKALGLAQEQVNDPTLGELITALEDAARCLMHGRLLRAAQDRGRDKT